MRKVVELGDRDDRRERREAAREDKRQPVEVRAEAGTDCVCSDPECDTTAKHPPGVPCSQTACPRCGKPMERPGAYTSR